MKIILLFGPTAVGKTELISNLFKKNYEIINADSMQVYKALNVGTAKPASELLDRIRHHLIDIRSPKEQFHAGDFVRLADKIAIEITERGNIPVICGGTAFYFKSYLFGLPDVPEIDSSVREKLQFELKKNGPGYLYSELKKIDPVRSEKLHPNDEYRILRALEVARGSGKLQSDFIPGDILRKGIEPLILGLRRDRPELYNRIDRRVDGMFEAGLFNEIKRCFKTDLLESDPGMRGIGYREFYLMNRTGEFTISDIRDIVKRNSRRYAKRQMTFFKSLPDVKWFHPNDADLIRDEIAGFLNAL